MQEQRTWEQVDEVKREAEATKAGASFGLAWRAAEPPPTASAPTTTAAAGLGGLLGGLLGVQPAPAPAASKEDEVRALRTAYKEAQRKVDSLRGVGGVALQEAAEALRLAEPRYRQAKAELRAAEQQLDDDDEPPPKPRAKAESPASQLSARRLERHNARMEARGAAGGVAGVGAADAAGRPILTKKQLRAQYEQKLKASDKQKPFQPIPGRTW
jgi:exonuclease VII small subunit